MAKRKLKAEPDIGKMLSRPDDAGHYAWEKFLVWCAENGVQLDNDDDWKGWWPCWKAAYAAAMNS